MLSFQNCWVTSTNIRRVSVSSCFLLLLFVAFVNFDGDDKLVIHPFLLSYYYRHTYTELYTDAPQHFMNMCPSSNPATTTNALLPQDHGDGRDVDVGTHGWPWQYRRCRCYDYYLQICTSTLHVHTFTPNTPLCYQHTHTHINDSPHRGWASMSVYVSVLYLIVFTEWPK